ncbi:ribonuclease H-like domain-containing protein [Amycolatopsis sp. NPDC059027]|uniref:ribonuclease H-like domain-containing protein n=1 Tax=Amycolatopsis sp. NPDC059027 TaxID=3346709 RepID=UPI003673168F
MNQVIEVGGVISFAARWVGEPKKNIVYRDIRDEDMFETAYSLLDEADSLLSWNGKGFDTKHMKTEFTKRGWTPFSPVKEIDMLKDVQREFRFASNKLEFVAQTLLGKGKQSHEGFGLWVKCLEGDEKAWARMERYNKQDVHLLIDLYNRLLPWLKVPNANLFDGKGCPQCGSGKIQKRGTTPTLVGLYQRYHCQSCGHWSRSGKSLNLVELR